MTKLEREINVISILACHPRTAAITSRIWRGAAWRSITAVVRLRKMPKPRQPKGVRPLVKHSRAYEQAMKREFLDPWMNQLRGRLATATSVNDVYHFLNQAVAVLEATPREGIPITQIIESLGRVRDYNRSKLLATFRSALGVDIRPFLQEAGIQQYMAQRVVENIDLIKNSAETFPRGDAPKSI